MAQTAKKSEPKLVDQDTISELVSTETAAEITPEINIAQKLEGESVADTLIRARQQYGQDLRSIAQVLCIRYSYLDAIERANYENLPGPTYAVGFVRTYAEFLGLDGDAVVERFKNEVQGLDGQTKLHFPTPAPEGKMPGGAVFLVAAFIFAGAYGVWFYLSNKGESIADLVSPVPERLQELAVEEAPAALPSTTTASGSIAPLDTTDPAAAPAEAPSAPTDTAEAAATPGSTPAPVPQASSSAVTEPEASETEANLASTGNAASEGASGSSPTTDPSAGIIGTPAEVGTPPAAPESAVVSEPAASTEGSSEPLQSSATPVIALQQPESAATGDTAALARQQDEGDGGLSGTAGQTAYTIPAAPANNQASSFLVNQEPQVYGGDNTDARIVLKASQDAWVQVRDREGTLLLTRVLRVGDSYRVPNQEDLTLLTGNAGGLQILVDGTALAPLGPVGAVRRNVPLDPEQLLSGANR